MKAHKDLRFTEARKTRTFRPTSRASGFERGFEEGRHRAWGRIGRVKGRGSRSSNVVEPAPVHHDTNDTKSMASDIGTIRKGRMGDLAELNRMDLI
jgi:hypothetical protein